MTDRALINKIIPFSCVDGEGNRMVIFFQGCNLRCTYCHNPETINNCIHCGVCVSACPVGALQATPDRVLWNATICTGCDNCITICPHLSTPKATTYTLDQLLEEVRKAKPFIRGITVSGGECTLQSEFLIQLFNRVHQAFGLTCYIDTNGMVDFSLYPDLLEVTDGFMLDVKSIDSTIHRRLTGADNKTVLKNLSFLRNAGQLKEVRTVISESLDYYQTVSAVSECIGDSCLYKLLSYRPNGVREEGLVYHGTESPSSALIQELIQLAEQKGCTRVTSV